MTVNWQQEVDQRKEALLDDLVELLKVKKKTVNIYSTRTSAW